MVDAQEIISESRKKLVKKIIENIEKGDLLFGKNWDSQMMMPKNPVSKVNYLGGNRVRLIAAAIEKEYKDPRWVTFKQASENGWSVRRGEKGTLCEKWIFTKKETEIDEKGNKIEKEIKLDKPIANYFYVFNAEQIENIPKLEIKNFTKDETNEIIQNFINSSECKIKEVAQDKAYYNPEKDEIVLPLRESFANSQEFLATTFHEMVHSTGHKNKLNRDLTGTYGSESYAKEELVSELGSVFLQSKLGVKLEGKHIDNHSAYLQSWLKILKNDHNEIFRAAAKAEKASERLHEKYLKYEREKETSKNKEETLSESENIKALMKDNPYISKKELVEKTGIDEKELNKKIGKLIKDKEIFYLGNKENIKYYTDKSEYIKDVQKQEVEKEIAKEERKKELENLIKETIKKEIPKDNYNVLTGNPIIAENHSSGDKRWIAMADIKDNNIPIKDNQNSTLTIVLYDENGKLHANPIEYYNVSQLEISKELEQKFVPMKEKEKNVEKSKDRGIER